MIQVFARPPVKGRVKTRLIPDLGARKATLVYQYCLKHTLNLVRESGYEYQLWLSEETQDPVFSNESFLLQQGSDLGLRMLHALEFQLQKNSGGHGRALLIGTDCLDLTETHIRQAIEALSSHEIVLLPAHDGGFALIGARKIDARLFAGVKWGGAEVSDQTIKNAHSLGYQVSILETVRDIDTLEDINHYPELLSLIGDS